jgi:hypothetical protein
MQKSPASKLHVNLLYPRLSAKLPIYATWSSLRVMSGGFRREALRALQAVNRKARSGAVVRSEPDGGEVSRMILPDAKTAACLCMILRLDFAGRADR